MDLRVNQYRLVVSAQDADGDYLATCPAFPGLSTFGPSPAEAVQEARGVVEAFIESYEAEGWPLPTPDAVPDAPDRFAPEQFSGQFRLRLPRSLHAALAHEAEGEGVSLNTLIVTRLAGAGGRAA